MNYDKIGNFIQKKRKEKNLTQMQLAEKIGVTDRAISKWERGLGCPDVSILEILSRELDCSILELLKGREIENEVIPVLEADDYVRDSMSISKQITKDKIMSIINKIIVGSIIFIILLIVYYNILQVYYVNEEHVFNISRDEHKKIQNKVKIVEDNLKVIQNNQGKFSDEDYKYMVDELDNRFNLIKEEKMYEYLYNRKDIYYTINDLSTFIYSNTFSINSLLAITRVLEKYSDDNLSKYYRDVITDSFILGGNADYLDFYNSYQYKFVPFNDRDTFYYVENKEMRILMYKLYSDLSELGYLTELVIEVGDIHE